MENRMNRLNVMQQLFNKKFPYAYMFTHFQGELLFFGACGF